MAQINKLYSFNLDCFNCSASVWVSSEYKTMHEDCEHFERFQPGTLYSSKDKAFRRWYNPPWFSEAIPSTPYDPMVLRHALEKVYILYYYLPSDEYIGHVIHTS